MQGLYADGDFRLVVIFALSDDEWDVYGVDRSKGWVGDIHKLRDDTYSLTANGTNCKGSYDGHGSIVWEDGATWTRVDVSSEQVYLLTRRPYVPLTLAFCVVLRDCVVSLACSVASYCKASVRPRVHVL